MRAVREVHAGDIHAVLDHFHELGHILAGGPDGADDARVADRVRLAVNVQIAQMVQICVCMFLAHFF